MKNLFFWAMLYQLICGICDCLQQWLGFSQWITATGLTVFLLALAIWSIRTGCTKALGLCKCMFSNPIDFLIALLLLLPAGINLVAGGLVSNVLPALWVLICAALTEEILFRGFALKAFCRHGALWGILGSSALFAALHGLNLFQNTPPGDVLLQCLFAFFAGICYAGVALRTGSLIPCALAHILTNLTGYSLCADAVRPLYLIGSAAFALIGIPYIVILFRNITDKENAS